MTQAGEDALIELVAREQRGFRRIMVSGFVALVLVIIMSLALAVYYYWVTQSLADGASRLDRQAFELRRAMDSQVNAAADRDAAIRRAYEEIRNIARSETPIGDLDDALDVAETYLTLGSVTLAGERIVEATASPVAEQAEARLLQGVLHLQTWDQLSGQISDDAGELPQELKSAREMFASVTDNADFGHLAHIGLARVLFEEASSPLSNYALAHCQEIFDSVAASAVDNPLAPLPLYWKAQCERKLGLSKKALASYAMSLVSAQNISQSDNPSQRYLVPDAELELMMNAYHGLGTVLITSVDIPEDEDLRSARDLAATACNPVAGAKGSEAMQLADACLSDAISLRKSLKQTDNQLNGTLENRSFVFLRDQDYEAALDNTQLVHKNGLLAWNELMRAYIASKLEMKEIEGEARRNVALFQPSSFNICELKKLLNTDDYDGVREIIMQEHENFEASCQ